MNPPNPSPLTTTHDAGLNKARTVLSNPEAIALAAVLMNRGLVSFEEIRDVIMRARAVPK